MQQCLILISYNLQLIAYNYFVLNAIDEATKLYCIGCTCVFMGMNLIQNKSFTKNIITINIIYSKSMLFIIAFLCNKFTLIFLNLGYLGLLIKIFSLSMLIGIIFFTRLWIKEKVATYRYYTLSLYVIASISSLLFSYLRPDIIMSTVILFLELLIGSGDIKKVIGIRLVPFVILFFIILKVFGDLGRYRGSMSNAAIG